MEGNELNAIFLALSDPSGKSGNNISTKEIISALGRNKNVSELAVLCPEPKDNVPAEITGYLNSKYFLPSKKNKSPLWHLKCQFSILNKLRKYNLNKKFDAMIVRKTLLMIAPIILSKFGLPMYLLIRGIGSESEKNNRLIWLHKKIFGRLQIKSTVKNSSKIYIAYKEVEEKLNNTVSTEELKDKMKYFTNAVNPELFKPVDLAKARNRINSQNKFNISEDDFLVGFAGSIKHRHCLPELIKGFKIASNSIQNRNLKLLVVGDGPYLDDLKSMIRKEKLSDQVILTGFISHNEVSDYINSCNLLYGVVHPDLPSNPIKCYEYLSCGRPIITSEKDEFNFVKKINCGFIIKQVKGEAVAEKIEESYNMEREKLMDMGYRGRKYVSENHTWDSLIDMINEDFENNIICS